MQLGSNHRCSAVKEESGLFEGRAVKIRRALVWVVLVHLSFAPHVFGDVNLGRVTPHSPYDAYLGPVRKTFARFRGSQPTVDEVRAQLRTARRFHYYFDNGNPYVPVEPEITDATRQGDCKGKSLWLAWKMDDRRVRFTIGKVTPSARMSHAWLLWNEGGEWFALDPTNESDLLPLQRIAGHKLFPQYSYSTSAIYVHSQ